MGGIHVVVEVAARDVARVMQFHKVHPQVQEEVNRRMQELVRLSVANLQLRQNAPNVPAASVVSWVLDDVVRRVVDVEIPKIQVADAEMHMADLQQELSLAKEALAEHEREKSFVDLRLKHMEEAKEYLMQSYFREVATLRQHISELESHQQQPSPSRNSSQPMLLGGKRTESNLKVLRHGGEDGGCGAPTPSFTPTSALLMPPTAPHPTATMGSSGMLTLPLPPEQQLEISVVGASLIGHHHHLSAGVEPSGSGGCDGKPSTPLRPPLAAHPSSSTNHPHTSLDGGGGSRDAVQPTHEVDALFDYERYVSITNEAIVSWPQRYDALQKKYADTVHHMQLAAASAALQTGKQIAMLQKDVMDRDVRVAKLSQFVRLFHPIVMECVKTVKAQMSEENRNLRRDMKALQNDHLDSVVGLSDRLFDLDMRHQLFASFVTYCSGKLQHKLRLVQEGHRVRATHGKPLWQFFLISGKEDAFAAAKTFWQDQACVKEILENYKQAMLTLERISINAFGPPSDDEDWTAKEFEETTLAKPHRNSTIATTSTTSGGGGGGAGKGSGGGRGRGRVAGKTAKGAITARGSASRSPSQRQHRSDSGHNNGPHPADDGGRVSATTSPPNRSENTTPLSSSAQHPQRSSSVAGQDTTTAMVSPNTSLREDALLREISTPLSGSSGGAGGTETLPLKPQTSPPLQRPLTRENSLGVGGGAHRGSLSGSNGSTFRKGEDFIHNLLRRMVDAKLRRIMCRVRRTVFLRRLSVDARNVIIRMQKIDDELKSADAAVDRYEKRKNASESKLRKDVISQSLTGGSLFSSLHSNKKAFGARRGSQQGGAAPLSLRGGQQGARNRPAEAAAEQETLTNPPPSNSAQPRPSIDSADLLQSFTAFGNASGGGGADSLLNNSGGGSVGPSSHPPFGGVPAGTNWASQLLGHTTAVSYAMRTPPGAGAGDATQTRGFTPLSASGAQRRGSDVSFHGIPDNVASATEQHLEVPVGASRLGCSTGRKRSPSTDDTTVAMHSTTPLPLLMISRSPQPTPDFLHNQRQADPLQRVVQSVVQQSVDADDVDANVFRIQSLSARRGTPGRGGGRLTNDDSGKVLAFAIPTLSAATSRGIADRSHAAYAHELQLRVSATPTASHVRMPGHRGRGISTPSTPAQHPGELPDLRQQIAIPAMVCRQATPLQVRTPRTPSSSPRVPPPRQQ